MANKRHKPDEIVTKLRQVEVLRGQGKAVADLTLDKLILTEAARGNF